MDKINRQRKPEPILVKGTNEIARSTDFFSAISLRWLRLQDDS